MKIRDGTNSCRDTCNSIPADNFKYSITQPEEDIAVYLLILCWAIIGLAVLLTQFEPNKDPRRAQQKAIPDKKLQVIVV
jgi:hypothetical protein